MSIYWSDWENVWNEIRKKTIWLITTISNYLVRYYLCSKCSTRRWGLTNQTKFWKMMLQKFPKLAIDITAKFSNNVSAPREVFVFIICLIIICEFTHCSPTGKHIWGLVASFLVYIHFFQNLTQQSTHNQVKWQREQKALSFFSLMSSRLQLPIHPYSAFTAAGGVELAHSLHHWRALHFSEWNSGSGECRCVSGIQQSLLFARSAWRL